MASKARVVVTGLGAVSPLGVGVQESWAKLCRSVSESLKSSKIKFHQKRPVLWCEVGRG